MEGFEVGRRRPLKRNTAIDSTKSSRLEKDDNSRLFDKIPREAIAKKKHTISKPEDNPHKVLPLIEVDLHIHELVDTTAGMDNYAMLQFQLYTVKKVMKANSKRIGQKIVFIHGKGDGVLRKEVRALLAKEYASCEVQDASFLKYGFGATEVTIHNR